MQLLLTSAAFFWLLVRTTWAAKAPPGLRSQRASALQVEKTNSSQAPGLERFKPGRRVLVSPPGRRFLNRILQYQRASANSSQGKPKLRNGKASALQVGHRHRKTRRTTPCEDGAENRYPSTLDSSYTIVGVAQGKSVWDIEKLRERLSSDPQWKVGQPWVLSVKVTNNGKVDREFGFMGGGGDTGGFLKIKVPAGAIEEVITVTGNVTASANFTEFQYRSSAGFTSGEVIMSDICLTPKTCKGYVCSTPSLLKRLDDTTFGHSDLNCCEPTFCQKEVACSPSTKYAQKVDFDEKLGSTLEACCNVVECPADICENDTKWTRNPASGLLGSTKEECCVAQECIDYSCSDPSQWKKLPETFVEGNKTMTRKGGSDFECCESRSCSTFKIPDEMASFWKLKENASQLSGNTYDQCCEQLLCVNFTCPDDTRWQQKPNTLTLIAGSTREQCCDKRLCSAYNCSKSSLEKKMSPSQRQGSTDEECCEMKFCSDYKCSDPTKWVHKSDQEANSNLDRRGNSDEECCDKIMCGVEVCNPVSKFSFLEQKRQGSTPEQCCETKYCGNYTCDTDADGDGQGTQWYKRRDTNTFRFQGSTNEECCHPKYCTQYTTLTPTKWKRKPEPDLLGSTDTECYSERWCSDYCCIGKGWVLKPRADTRMGSTDTECCINQNQTSPLPEFHQERDVPDSGFDPR